MQQQKFYLLHVKYVQKCLPKGALFSASERGSRIRGTAHGREGVKMDLFQLHTQPCPTTDAKSGIQCPWGFGGCMLGGKGHTTQLCRLMEKFCRRTLSHAADSSTFMHDTHSSTDCA